MTTLQEALRNSRLTKTIEKIRSVGDQINEQTERMNGLLRGIEDRIRSTPGTCRRVASVPFKHPSYDDPHELAWSSRNGRWRLVLRWADGADPVLGCSREVRAAVLGSEELQDLLFKLDVIRG